MIPKIPREFSHPMRIGEGAFASVFRVRQAALERWVALKFIYEKDRVKRHELLGEAKTQAQLHADCVPQIYDAFEWRHSVCMVMEWVRGVSLATLLNRSLSTDDRLSLAGELIKALAAIHGQGFAHRDLKPENVIISPGRGLFLVDFGFSKHIADWQVSSATTAKGTPAYMAPELWSRGEKVDLMRADIYAAGRILLQVLSETFHAPRTATLLHDNPQRRPASGRELLAQWEKEGILPRENTDWKRIAGNPTAELLSDNLLRAAQQLLYAHRPEEAYWLLVESLEENGNNHEAMELMGSFQGRTGKRITAVHYLIFALLLAGGVVLAFFAGAKSGNAGGTSLAAVHRQRMPLLSSVNSSPVGIGAVPLREDTMHHDKLSGRLVVRNMPSKAALFVDSRAVDVDTAVRYGLRLHRGEHTITLCDSTGRNVRHEMLHLLPFQTKAIDLQFRTSRSKQEWFRFSGR